MVSSVARCLVASRKSICRKSSSKLAMAFITASHLCRNLNDSIPTQIIATNFEEVWFAGVHTGMCDVLYENCGR